VTSMLDASLQHLVELILKTEAAHKQARSNAAMLAEDWKFVFRDHDGWVILLWSCTVTRVQAHEDGEQVTVLSVRNIDEKLDGKEAAVTMVEVTIEPGKAGLAHRHPGPAFVYAVEGGSRKDIPQLSPFPPRSKARILSLLSIFRS